MKIAVEWFAEQIESGKIEIVYSDKIHSIKCIPEIIQQAKEMQKEQIENAWYDGYLYEGKMPDHECVADRYYKKSYR
jgi:hypothetical protein